VLEVGAETLGLERSPEVVLVHGGGVLRPGWEAVGIEWEVGLQGLDRFGVFVEEDLLFVEERENTSQSP
jgi:hypothetical protein